MLERAKPGAEKFPKSCHILNKMKHKRRFLKFVISFLLVAGLVCFGTASGAGFVVDDFGEGSDSNLNDNACGTAGGTCTLRAAIQQANFTSGLDTIEFDSNGTVLLSSGYIDIKDSLIMRPGAASQITISSASQSILFIVTQNGTTVVFEDLEFSNSAGQAIIVGSGPQVTIRRCVFDGNINGSGSAAGGALSIGGETIIDTSEFRNNSSDITSGGAIFLGTGAFLTIRNSVIEDNSAKTGGGIAVGSGLERLVLEDVLIQRNHASSDGGGIYSQSRVESAGVTLYQNTSNRNGGGIWASNKNGSNFIDALKLVGADVRGNTADENGGGIYIDTGVGQHPFLISRSAVWENDANLGGGIFVSGLTDIKVANTTLGVNTATSGGGIYLQGGNLDILHATIWNNQAEQLRNHPSVLGNIGNSIIGFDVVGASGCNNLPNSLGPNLGSDASCGATLVGDPKLGPITNTGGYAPTQPFADGSPALEAADLSICSAEPISFYDSDGPNRPNGKQCDLGAWESSLFVFLDGFED